MNKLNMLENKVILILAITVLLFTACRNEKPLKTSAPVLVIGMDGLEWDILLPLIKEKKMPNIESLMEAGCYGKLETFVPTSSPIIWTSIATGKKREKHGIVDFSRRSSDGTISLLNNDDRKTKALWNILSDYNKKSVVIGWWMTYPVEEINGIMVAQTNTKSQLDTREGKNIWKGVLLKGVKGQVWPESRQNEMIEILEGVDKSMNKLTDSIFGEFPFPLSLLGERLWSNCKWAFRADETYRRIALKVINEGDIPDLTLLYLGGSDVVSHRFWRYMKPEIFSHKPSDEEVSNFGNIIEDYYIYYDGVVGEILKSYGKNVNVFIMSDHGMHSFNKEQEFNPDKPPQNVSSGNHQDGPSGVFIAEGPQIRKIQAVKDIKELKKENLRDVCTVFDITPTILGMMRIPAGRDMDGKLISEIFKDDFKIKNQPDAIQTHDSKEFLDNRKNKGKSVVPGEEERINQLRSLGYIGN